MTMTTNALPFDIGEGYYEKPASSEKPKSEKRYILLISFNDGTGDRTFIELVGQKTARDYLKDEIDTIDIDQSYVLVEDAPFAEGKPTVYEFFKLIEGNFNDGFDIEQYTLHKIQNDDDDEKRYLNDGDAETPTYQGQQSQDMLINGNNVKEIL